MLDGIVFVLIDTGDDMRIETDTRGNVTIQDKTLYGINTVRALDNFPSSLEDVNPCLIKAYLQVKLAAANTNYKTGILPKEKHEPLTAAIKSLLNECDECIETGSKTIYSNIVVDPFQGGAGTSLNMNINEVIANKALLLIGKEPGQYNFIHPIDDVNLSQSTNDTYVTALKIASIILLRRLTEAFALLQRKLQEKEKEFSNIIKLGRTQLQDAVPITLGQEFGAWAQAIARDRWRLYNCEERLRSVNLGGTAVGNSVNAGKKYVLSVVSELKSITGLPIAKAVDMIDATQNLDMFVEVHGIVKAGACSLIKIANDIRFLSSGPDGGIGEIEIPKLQAGSSIMPGKANPVIPEYVIQISELVKGHDVIISNLVSSGNLELNSFSPMIAHLFLKTLSLLHNTLTAFSEKCIDAIKANKERCRGNLINSSAIAAFLINDFGYEKISSFVNESYETKIPFYKLIRDKKLVTEEKLIELINNQLGIINE